MKTKLWDLIEKVGTGVVREVVPGGGLLIDVVNEWLPKDKKLPSNATGKDIDRAIQELPAEQRAELQQKEFDVDIVRIQQTNETLRAMLDSDAKNPHTTRPYIAKQSFHVVAYTNFVVVTAWAYGVVTGNATMVDTVVDGYSFVLSIVGPLTALLLGYFGILRGEQSNRLKAASGQPIKTGFLSSVVTSRSK